MFSTSNERDSSELTHFFLVPPSAGVSVQTGETLEEVRFMRDEAANLVWAIEKIVPNGIGEPWRAQERAGISVAPEENSPPAADEGEGVERQLRYRIQTTVPGLLGSVRCRKRQ